ncbi:MAG: Gfo/Idh/MocA family protein [Planctomycetota bacterium]
MNPLNQQTSAQSKWSRRSFLAAAGAAPLAVHTLAAAAAEGTAPNDRIQMGFIGLGTMGTSNLKYAMQISDIEVVAVCDVYQPHLDRAVAEAQKAGHQPRAIKDFREVLADPSIDAVCISTPDHWHAYMMIEACKAGKDVYVEKPACIFVEEGLKMVEAARRYDRIVQAGTMQRSGGYFQKAASILQSGTLGEVTFCRLSQYSNKPVAGIGRFPDTAPPEGLDWDMWLGPAPLKPFNEARWRPATETWATFRYFWDYAGGKLTDWGVHLLDTMHFVFRDQFMPRSVVALGGKLHYEDGTETPDTLTTVLEYPGFITNSECVSGSTHVPLGRDASTAFHGTEATLVVNRGGCYLMPEKTSKLKSMGETSEELKEMNLPHWKNFVECVRSRQKPIAEIETCVRSTIPLLLANISYRFKTRVDWDEAQSTVLQEQVKEQLKARYRDPWKLEV